MDDAFGSESVAKYIQAKYKHAVVFHHNGAKYMLWNYNIKQKEGFLVVPRGFDDFMKKNISNPKKTQIAVFLTLESTAYNVGHANVVIISKNTKEIEIFEPNGLKLSDSFGTSDMYKELRSYFTKFLPEYKLRLPIDYCPKKTAFFQDLETDEKAMWKTEGYCAVWTVWYTEHRLANPLLSTKDCMDVALARLIDLGSLREFIWNYDRWMRRQTS
jgi:hypothetical protein